MGMITLAYTRLNKKSKFLEGIINKKERNQGSSGGLNSGARGLLSSSLPVFGKPSISTAYMGKGLSGKKSLAMSRLCSYHVSSSIS
jgi:hypothetical protein